eukprot:CAMPEP_0181125604 /NCGR_PEP_ID=MMETSP1071-20121207/27144_1 /TAXON_ID=35127 /ORGANISM="Thalassiosira sp., Strain NH16" /LENGTH=307 /DNA_ID=CAMNT_0023211069 /DNA_START=89 /DNA_END=1012 /DNA_ORIENTATION=-
MRLLSAATSLLLPFFLLLNGAASQDCPNSISLEEWVESKFNSDSLTLRHAIVLASSPGERNILCARLESDIESYIGFAISPSGEMDGAVAVIGLPEDGTVQKYTLAGARSAVPMPIEQQTLMYTTISQNEGTTEMEFAKYLEEDGEPEILPVGETIFLYSQGSGNSLGFHRSYGDFSLSFNATAKLSSSTIAPSPAGSNGGTGVGTIMEAVGVGLSGRTIAPTSGYVARDPAPAPVPPPSSADATPDPSDPSPDPSDPSPDPSDPSPDPPTPPAPGTNTGFKSVPLVKKIANSIILGAGAFAVWFEI